MKDILHFTFKQSNIHFSYFILDLLYIYKMEDESVNSIKKHIRELFVFTDVSNNGSLPISELSGILVQMGVQVGEKELQEIIKVVDPLNTSNFKCADLERYLVPRLSKFTVDEFYKSLSIFDFDKDGKISMEDFENAMTTFGNPLLEDELISIKKEIKADVIDIKAYAQNTIKY
jgi:Ca2+-binding EF-hand superfamily protein